MRKGSGLLDTFTETRTKRGKCYNHYVTSMQQRKKAESLVKIRLDAPTTEVMGNSWLATYLLG